MKTLQDKDMATADQTGSDIWTFWIMRLSVPLDIIKSSIDLRQGVPRPCHACRRPT